MRHPLFFQRLNSQAHFNNRIVSDGSISYSHDQTNESSKATLDELLSLNNFKKICVTIRSSRNCNRTFRHGPYYGTGELLVITLGRLSFSISKFKLTIFWKFQTSLLACQIVYYHCPTLETNPLSLVLLSDLPLR